MTRFLITGLPRSRTAWFTAAAHIVPGAICRHEPLICLQPGLSLSSLWDLPRYEHVGASDSVLSLHLPQLFDEMPDLRVLVIERDIKAIEASIARLGLQRSKILEIMMRRLVPYRSHPNVKWVQFDQIGGCIEDCLLHLMPGVEIDWRKLYEFLQLNIQTDYRKRAAQALARADDYEFLLGAEALSELRTLQ